MDLNNVFSLVTIPIAIRELGLNKNLEPMVIRLFKVETVEIKKCRTGNKDIVN